MTDWIKPFAQGAQPISGLRLELIGGRWHASVSAADRSEWEHADAQTPHAALREACICLDIRLRHIALHPEFKFKNTRNAMFSLGEAAIRLRGICEGLGL